MTERKTKGKTMKEKFTNKQNENGTYGVYCNGALVATVPTYGAVVVVTKQIKKNMGL
jgi:hypothetical protein